MTSEIDKLDVDKLVPIPVYLKKLSDVVRKYVKKDVYNGKIRNIEDQIPGSTNVATTTTVNTKINEVKNEIPSITNLATTAALNGEINKVKNKVSNITNLATTAALTALKIKYIMLVILLKNCTQHKNYWNWK